MPLRPCIECGTITDQARCPDHRRGTTTARGYDAAHQRERAAWAPHVDAGQVNCARCDQRIAPGTPWDLDHTDDRRGYLGPSHARCNRATRRK